MLSSSDPRVRRVLLDGVHSIEFKARRAREQESLTFPRQAKVKPLIAHIYSASRTRQNHDNGLYVAIPLFLNTKFFEI